MKQTVAVSLTLQQLASLINDCLAAAAGDTVPWALVLQTDGVAQYVANTSREDGQKLIESLLDRWRAGRADIPAHYNPDLAKSAETESTLKPCPFCGGAAEIRQFNNDPESPNFAAYYIECQECGASTNLRYPCGEDPRPELREQWNTRAPSR